MVWALWAAHIILGFLGHGYGAGLPPRSSHPNTMFPNPMTRVIPDLPWCLENQELHQELGLGWALRSKLLGLHRPVSVSCHYSSNSETFPWDSPCCFSPSCPPNCHSQPSSLPNWHRYHSPNLVAILLLLHLQRNSRSHWS